MKPPDLNFSCYIANMHTFVCDCVCIYNESIESRGPNKINCHAHLSCKMTNIYICMYVSTYVCIISYRRLLFSRLTSIWNKFYKINSNRTGLLLWELRNTCHFGRCLSTKKSKVNTWRIGLHWEAKTLLEIWSRLPEKCYRYESPANCLIWYAY